MKRHRIILVVCFWLVTSPLWGKIAFYSTRDGNSEIYTMDSDGGNQTRFTFNEASDVNPVWSPNGQQIAFGSDRDGNWEVYVMDADGQNQRRLTHHPGIDGYPDWSPDGSQIAFDSTRSALEIYVMNVDGGDIKQVTDLGFASRPRWSPDGQWILFMAGQIYAIRPDGTDQWRVSEPKPDAGMYLGGWSPDGKQIVYVEAIHSSVNASTPVIVTLPPADPQGGLKRVAVKIPRRIKALHSVSFSADGKAILFNGKKHFVREGVKGDSWNIYRFGLVDKQLIRLTHSQGADVVPQEWNPRLPISPQELTPTRWGKIKTTK